MENSARNGSEESEDLERKHFQRIINAFKYYRTHSMRRIRRAMRSLSVIPQHHQAMLSNYKHHLDYLVQATDQNNQVIKLIVKDVECIFDNVAHKMTEDSGKFQVTDADMDKVQSTLKQFVRDWSVEGEEERNTCYLPIIEEIVHRFPLNKCNPENVNILVPGAGLGRLAFELAQKGYSCQGNEFSLFMLFASNFVLNKCRGVNLYKIFPWSHHYCNNVSSNDQIKSVLFPDTDPSNLPSQSKFSMAAGDFLEIYTEKDSWDCVACCFFIDTASNICQYVETIWNILKPGGYWINLGPLLYHFADLENDQSIEPSYEDLRDVIRGFGFEFLKEKTNVKTSYSQNPNSMMKHIYDSVFFVCRKPFEDEYTCQYADADTSDS